MRSVAEEEQEVCKNGGAASPNEGWQCLRPKTAGDNLLPHGPDDQGLGRASARTVVSARTAPLTMCCSVQLVSRAPNVLTAQPLNLNWIASRCIHIRLYLTFDDNFIAHPTSVVRCSTSGHRCECARTGCAPSACDDDHVHCATASYTLRFFAWRVARPRHSTDVYQVLRLSICRQRYLTGASVSNRRCAT
jgi:hypothetical protein